MTLMTPDEIKTAALDIIKNNPGYSLNQIFRHGDPSIETNLNKKFPPFHKVITELRTTGVIKVDDKKKSTGHYMADVPIENVGTAPRPVAQKGDGSAPGSSTEFTGRYRRNVERKRFVLEKNEGFGWKGVDSNEIEEPIMELYRNVCTMLPTRYRVMDTIEDKLMAEKTDLMLMSPEQVETTIIQ